LRVAFASDPAETDAVAAVHAANEGHLGAYRGVAAGVRPVSAMAAATDGAPIREDLERERPLLRAARDDPARFERVVSPT
jgi:hypothetical protein